ncbi:hypothetical protein ACUXV3_02675 [Roseobacteraceae bacterium NS-SX3]
MTKHDLLRAAERLEERIQTASGPGRLAMQPEFHHVLNRLKACGAEVPRRMRRLDHALCEEAVEDQFDNMPV